MRVMTGIGAGKRISPVKEQSKATFGFLDLPAEIRQQIYRLLLVQPKRGRSLEFPRPLGCTHHIATHPQILATCRHIHNEAAVILYAKNELLIQSSNLQKFAGCCLRTGDHNKKAPAALIKRIFIDWPTLAESSARVIHWITSFVKLYNMKGLQRVTILRHGQRTYRGLASVRPLAMTARDDVLDCCIAISAKTHLAAIIERPINAEVGGQKDDEQEDGKDEEELAASNTSMMRVVTAQEAILRPGVRQLIRTRAVPGFTPVRIADKI